jgi:hypothetical protein
LLLLPWRRLPILVRLVPMILRWRRRRTPVAVMRIIMVLYHHRSRLLSLPTARYAHHHPSAQKHANQYLHSSHRRSLKMFRNILPTEMRFSAYQAPSSLVI